MNNNRLHAGFFVLVFFESKLKPKSLVKLKTIEKLSVEEITDLFNRAFEDYFVKIDLTPEYMAGKLDSEGLDPMLSLGVFKNESPVAFMLHALRNVNGKRIAYNGGTGVIKAFRGQHLTVKMYEKQIELLREKGAEEIELEVIADNVPAIRSYEKVGFRKTAVLECFKGVPASTTLRLDLEIGEIEAPDMNVLETFWDWNPTWQNASDTIKKLPAVKLYGAFLFGKLAGYLAVQPEKSRILQFAVAPEHRRKKIAGNLFQYFSRSVNGEINVNNINDPTGSSQAFLRQIGLHCFLTQHKMNLKLNTQ